MAINQYQIWTMASQNRPFSDQLQTKDNNETRAYALLQHQEVVAKQNARRNEVLTEKKQI